MTTNVAVSADAYDGYMGRYSRLLAPLLVDFANVERGQRVLDVGCGPGALTSELAIRVGGDRVAAADPTAGFVLACADRVPEADLRHGPAEELPWPADSFDVVLSQLVVSFLRDADAGIREMRRVARVGGIVASCTWDYTGDMQMLRTFWDAALALDPAAPDEARTMKYARFAASPDQRAKPALCPMRERQREQLVLVGEPAVERESGRLEVGL
jgi:ubiquinone/menaquinone biosynthesis C-methylase UbiE